MLNSGKGSHALVCVEPQSVSEDRLGPLGLKVTGASHASELMVELSLETGIFTLLLRSHVTLGMWSHLSEPRPCLTSNRYYRVPALS